MMFRYKPIVVALALAISVPAIAAASPAPIQTLLSSEQLDMAALSQLYRQSVLEDDTSKIRQQLAAVTGSAQQQARALVIKGYFEWQQGDMSQALLSATQALQQATVFDSYLLQARLLETQGDTAGAVKHYQQAVKQAPQAKTQQQLTLRIAMLQSQPAIALQQLAQQQSQSFKNRVAVVQALSAQPQQALTLFRPEQDKTAGKQYSNAVRQADWAIAAADYTQAATYAWQAFNQTSIVTEQRYALAVLTEAFRQQQQLVGAFAFLQQQPFHPEVEQVKVDILLETGQYDAAIQRVSTATDKALRQRLPGILALAEREDALIAEYQRLMTAEPEQAQWYNELASLYMGQGRATEALAVYQQLESRNQGNIEVLVSAAEQMIAMGLQHAAIEMISRAGSDPALLVPVNFFLFETLLSQGRDAEAKTLLQQLQQHLAADSPRQLAVAEAYQRLYQPEQALAAFRQYEANGGKLGYDQQTQVAMLLSATGSKAEALALWQRLWRESTLPARKNYLEKQIIKLGQELKVLPALAAELQQQLASATAHQSDINLLVSIYLQQKDRDSAEAAVTTFAANSGLTEASMLEQLSVVYARLKDYPQLNQVLRKLVKLDPDNAATYLQRLTLNVLRYSNGQQDEQYQQQISQLLAELQQLNSDNNQWPEEFAAGIYVMASLDEQAIAQYRQAAARFPQRYDNLLQLAELLKKQQRQDEAIAMLQYMAEFAPDQNSFSIAVDGLINMFAVNQNSQARLPRRQDPEQVLRWAQRLVLERMIVTEDEANLYSLLADIAESLADFDLLIRAYENSLAEAGEQRPSILRQLITLTSGSDSYDNSGPALGNQAKKLQYGRRLLALKREYPPALYADLALSLLADDDELGAERAFAMMTDIGGLVNVAQIKGDTYQQRGYLDKALTNYSQALIRQQDSLELALKTSVLREQLHEEKLAAHWYWHALKNLLMQQPLQAVAISSGNAAELNYDRYYQTLTEGLLLTWPTDKAQQQAVTAQLLQLITDTLSAATPNHSVSALEQYPRLAALSRLLLRIAEHQQQVGLFYALEKQLAPYFSADQQYQAMMRQFRYQNGLKHAVTSDPQDLLGLLQLQAAEEDNNRLELALAIAAKDKVQLTRLVQQAVAAEQDYINQTEQKSWGRPVAFYSLLLETLEYLPEALFKEHVFAVLDSAEFRDDLLFDVVRSQPDSYRKLEAVVGKTLLADEQLLQWLISRGNEPFPMYHRYGGNILDYVVSRFSVPQLIALYHGFIRQAVVSGGESMLVSGVLQYLLRQPLTAEQQTALSTALQADIDRPQSAELRTGSYLIQKLLVLDAAEQNQALLLQAATQTARHYADARYLPDFLQQWFSGNRRQAYELLLKLNEDSSSRYAGGHNYAAPLIEQYFMQEQQQFIADFMQSAKPDKAQTEYFYREFILGNRQTRDVAQYYRKLLTLEPDNQVYVAGMLMLYWQLRNHDDFIRLLTGYVNRNPAQQDASAVLYFASVLLNDRQQAQQLQHDSKIDFNDVDWQVQMLNRAGVMRQGLYEPDFLALFNMVYARYTAANPDNKTVQAIKARQQVTPRRDTQDKNVASLLVAGADVPVILRGQWRSTAPIQGMLNAGISRQMLLQSVFNTKSHTPQAAELSDVLTSAPVMTEIEAYLLAMAPDVRQQQQRLYDLLVKGLIRQQQAQTRFNSLQQQLMDGTVNNHQLQLFLTLAEHLDYTADAGQLKLLTAVLQHQPLLSINQRWLLARLFARSGHYSTATDLLYAVTMQALYPARVDWHDAGEQAAMTLAQITSELSLWSDKQAAQQLYIRLMQALMNSQNNSVAVNALTEAFLISTAFQLADPKQAQILIQTIKPDVGAAVSSVVDYPEQALAIVRLKAEQQSYDSAWQLLQDTLMSQGANTASRNGDRNINSLYWVLYGNSASRPVNSVALLLQYAELIFPQAENKPQQSWQDFVADKLLAKPDDVTELNAEILLLLAERYLQAGEAVKAERLLTQAESILQQLPELIETQQRYQKIKPNTL